jgi:hypothetical protein
LRLRQLLAGCYGDLLTAAAAAVAVELAARLTRPPRTAAAAGCIAAHTADSIDGRRCSLGPGEKFLRRGR